jgi:hypothetical protein
VVSTRYTPFGRSPATPAGNPAVAESVGSGATVVAETVVATMVVGEAADESVAPDEEQPTMSAGRAINTSLAYVCCCFMMCSSLRTHTNLSRRA